MAFKVRFVRSTLVSFEDFIVYFLLHCFFRYLFAHHSISSFIYLLIYSPIPHLTTSFITPISFFFRHIFHNILHTSTIYIHTFPAHIHNALTHNLFDTTNRHLIPSNKGIACFVTCSFPVEFVSINFRH